MDAEHHTIRRRDFLRVAGLAGASGLLWACAPQAPAPAPTQAPAKPAEAKPAATAAPAVAAKPTEAAKPAEAKPAAQPTAAPAAAAKPSGTLTIAQGADTTSLDPHQTQASAPRGMMRSFLETLLMFDHDLKIQPWLATSYTLVNPTTWEFKLRDDVTFHNGEKFTAESVKWSVQRFVDPQTKNIYASVFEPISEVQAVDDYTVRMVTKTPMPSLPASLCTWLFMAPPKAMQEMGEEYFKKPIGTGPYKFVEWVPGERLVAEAVDKHWSGGPWVEKVVWRTITEPVARVTALRTGEADLIANVPPAQVSAVSGGGAEVIRSSGLAVMVLILNASQGPLADKKVRQALNYAIDKDKIIKALFADAAKPMNGPYNAFQEGYDPAAPPPYPYNPDKAKQLLAEAGHANGFKFTINTPSGRYLNDKQVAEAAAGDLAKVGVEMEVNPLEWGAMIKLFQEKQADAWLLIQNNLDTYQILSTCFHSKIKGIPWLGYNNPEVDALIDKAGQELDDKTRVDTYKQASKLIVDDAPWVFLHSQDDLYGVRDRVQNWKPKGDQVIYIFGTSVKG
jgi:peptide/nickel transport system substrate-binding protein